MSLPEITTRERWTAARDELLVREKRLTRERDALVADRRRLPMVEITEPYVFTGPDGARLGLLDLFEGRLQLVVGSFMFDPGWERGCSSCTAGADEISDGYREHLAVRDTTLAYVSLAPIEKLERYRRERGWTFPWYSSFGSTFNADFGASVPDGDGTAEIPGRHAFLRQGDRVFHTYSAQARGLETIGGSYYLLDETALGRQEEWEEPRGRADTARGAIPDFSS